MMYIQQPKPQTLLYYQPQPQRMPAGYAQQLMPAMPQPQPMPAGYAQQLMPAMPQPQPQPMPFVQPQPVPMVQPQPGSFIQMQPQLQPQQPTQQPGDQMPAPDGKYVDVEFPPINRSVFYSQNPAADHVQDIINGTQGGRITWRRITDILGPRQKLFNNIHPNDLAQGILGDCWLLAGIAGLAEFPGSIQALFAEKELSQNGCYHIYLFDSNLGAKQEVIIDDYIPLGPDSQPCFSKPQDNEAWALLLEKAVAKWFGSYVALAGAFAMTPFLLLQPCRYALAFRQRQVPTASGLQYDPNTLEVQQYTLANTHDRTSIRGVPVGTTSAQQAFEELKKADDANMPMACWTSKEPPQQAGVGASGEAIASDGIVKSHAYSLTMVDRYQADGRMWRIVQVRNPWGANPQAEWKGELSESWADWPRFPELYEKLGIGRQGLDGLFFMPWERFLDRFSDFGICPVAGLPDRFADHENNLARGIKVRGGDAIDVLSIKKFRSRGSSAYAPASKQARKTKSKGKKKKAGCC